MSITINNTTITSRLTIIFDAGYNPDNDVYYKKGVGQYNRVNADGPATGTGNTESDVYIDDNTYLNIRSHTEIPSDVHALQCKNNAGTWSFTLEKTDNSPNEVIADFASLPQWVTNVVIRCEAQDLWTTKFKEVRKVDEVALLADAVDNDDAKAKIKVVHDDAVTQADTERSTYLTANGITY